MKYAAYVRTGTDNAVPDDQLASIRKRLTPEDQIIEVHHDQASGNQAGSMLREIIDDPIRLGADTLLVSSLDRISRDPDQLAYVLDALFNKGVTVQATGGKPS